VLVVTEGRLVYFSPEQVARLASDLASRPAFGWWITDTVSPTLLKMLVKSRGAANETDVQPTFFGPAALQASRFVPGGHRLSRLSAHVLLERTT
jgi:O-methyltransferase involved in polyketide biosynthesis